MTIPPQTSKLYAAGLFLLVLIALVFVQAAFNLDPIYSPSEPNQILLLVTVSTFIFLVLLVFGFVLLRTLVKVWAERKQQKPGSKFKTTILLWLVTLTLIPAACLFFFAFALVNRSIDKWFSVPVDQIFVASGEMGAEWRRDHQVIERSILDYIDQPRRQDLEAIRRTFQLKSVLVLDSGGQVLHSSKAPDLEQSEAGEMATRLFSQTIHIGLGPSEWPAPAAMKSWP
jgi:nitrogen fixation/metabolism regulation signal transduction histidine kinase